MIAALRLGRSVAGALLKVTGLAACVRLLAMDSLCVAFATGPAASCCEAGDTSNGTTNLRGLVKILQLLYATNCVFAARILPSVPEMS